MQVFVVVEGDRDFENVIGVFTSLVKADEWIDARRQVDRELPRYIVQVELDSVTGKPEIFDREWKGK